MSTDVSASTVLDVLNEACDDVLGWADAPDTGARDVVNLVVNVFAKRLTEGPGDRMSINDIIREGYEATPEEVHDWCNDA